jgi:hypothetical protein
VRDFRILFVLHVFVEEERALVLAVQLHQQHTPQDSFDLGQLLKSVLRIGYSRCCT